MQQNPSVKMVATMDAISCRKCGAQLAKQEFIEKNHRVCPECNHHHYLSAFERLELLVDDGSFESHDDGLYSLDPLEFPDYVEKLERDAAAERTGERRGTMMFPLPVRLDNGISLVVGWLVERALQRGLLNQEIVHE